MNRLTRQEQLVLCSVLGLLLVGLAVKTYRTAHPGHTMIGTVSTASSTNASAGAKQD